MHTAGESTSNQDTRRLLFEMAKAWEGFVLVAARRLQLARYEFWTWRLLQSISSDGPSASWGRSSCIEPHSSCEKQRGEDVQWTLREWTLIDANKKIDR